LWLHLRRRALDGWKFRRQHVLAGYVADFYCPALRLVVEVDGPVHELRAPEDAARTAALEQVGAIVVRGTNTEVLHDAEAATDRILAVARDLARMAPTCSAERSVSPFPRIRLTA